MARLELCKDKGIKPQDKKKTKKKPRNNSSIGGLAYLQSATGLHTPQIVFLYQNKCPQGGALGFWGVQASFLGSTGADGSQESSEALKHAQIHMEI